MDVVLISDVPYAFGIARYAGIYRLATELRLKNIDTIVIDFFTMLSDTEIDAALEKFISKKTTILGVSSTFLRSYDPVIENVHAEITKSIIEKQSFSIFDRLQYIIKKAKALNPNIKTILGGANYNQESSFPPFDFYVKGQADKIFTELVQSIQSNKNYSKTSWNGSSYFLDANFLGPFQGFSRSQIIWEKEDCIQPNEWLPIEIARGCIFACSFCNYFQNGKALGDYMKDDAILREELIYNYENFGITSYLFSDDLYNDSIAKVEKYHKVFTSLPFDISWLSFGRLDLFQKYPEMADLLLESGLKSMFFGIETLNDEAGRRVGKGLGEKRTKDLLQFLNERWKDKIMTYGNFIIGLPGESKSSIHETFRWLISGESGLDSFGFTPLCLDEKNDFRVTEKDLSKISIDPEKFGYQLGDNSLDWNNANMDHMTAVNLSINFNHIAIHHKKIGTHDYGPLINLGYSEEQLFNEKFIFFTEDRINHVKRKIEWKNSYLNDLLNL